MILVNSYIYKLKGGIIKSTNNISLDLSDTDLQFKVNGMTCSHCKESVESVIRSFKSVINTTINLSTGDVLIKGSELDEAAIKEKITSIGFTVD